MGDILRKGVEHIPMVPLGVSKLEYLFINFSSLVLRVSLEILTLWYFQLVEYTTEDGECPQVGRYKNTLEHTRNV